MSTDIGNVGLQPCGFSEEQINEFVSKIVEVINPGGGSVDPFDVVKKIGGRVTSLPPSEWVENKYISKVEDDGSFTIFLPNYVSPLKNRFIVAHELGHFFLHSGMGENHIAFPITPSDMTCEAEAECFARSLLATQRIPTPKPATHLANAAIKTRRLATQMA